MKIKLFLFSFLLLYVIYLPCSFALMLTSDAIPDFGKIENKYRCTQQGGQNISPPLSWSEIPNHTRSFVLILHDPDAQHAGGFTHWIVYIANPHIHSLITGTSENTDIVFGKNGANTNTYLGPCPPAGTGIHRYQFILYALNTTLDRATISTLQQADWNQIFMKNAIKQTILTGFYGKN